MRFKTFIIILFFFSTSLGMAQNGDAILGNWMNEKKDKIVNIYKANDLYYGKIIWLKENDGVKGGDLLDFKNPNGALKKRNVVGINYLLSFAYYSDRKVWKEGQIYNFKSGNTYTGKIHLINENEIELTGYFGILWFLGRTKTWTRTTN